MPRYRTSLADAIAGMSEDNKRSRTQELSVPGIRHVTTNVISSSPPTGTWWGPGLFTVNQNLSRNWDFVKFPANDQFTLGPGLYSMHFMFQTPTGTGDGASWYLDNATTATRIAAGNKATGNISEQSFNVPNYFTPASATFNIKFFQASGGTQTWKITANITKWA